MKIVVLLGMLLSFITMYFTYSEFERGRVNPFVCAAGFVVSLASLGYLILLLLGICLVTPPGV